MTGSLFSLLFILMTNLLTVTVGKPLPPVTSLAGKCQAEIASLVSPHGVIPQGFEPAFSTERTLIGKWTTDPKVHPHHDEQQNPDEYFILSKKDFSQLGIIGIEVDTGVARLPLGVEEDVHGQGVGTEVKFAAVKYAFEKLNANVVEAKISVINKASQNLHRKLGFEPVPEPGNAVHQHWILKREKFKKVEAEFRRLQEAGEQPLLPRNRR